MGIADNRLLLLAVVSFIAFFVIGYTVPWPVFYTVVNVGLVISAGLVMIQHLPHAWRALVLRERLEGQPAAHLPVVGNFNISTGGVLAAMAALAMGTDLGPMIAQTPFELVGRGLASAGLILLLVSSSITPKGVQFESSGWIYAAIVVAAVLGGTFIYRAGVQTGSHLPMVSDDAHLPADAPRCPLGREIWGTDARVYHVPGGQHRRSVRAIEKCFSSVAEAEEAGFRAPG